MKMRIVVLTEFFILQKNPEFVAEKSAFPKPTTGKLL